MKLLDRPFFRSAAGHAFLMMQAFPGFLLLVAGVVWIFDDTSRPQYGVYIAAGLEVVIYCMCLVMYRLERSGRL